MTTKEYIIKVLDVGSFPKTFNSALILQKLPPSTKVMYGAYTSQGARLGFFKTQQAAYRVIIKFARHSKQTNISVDLLIQYGGRVRLYEGEP